MVSEAMNSALKTRMVLAANKARIFMRYKALLKDVALMADKWSASAGLMRQALNNRDIDLLSRSILENHSQSKQMSELLKRHERIMANMEMVKS